MQSIAPPRSCRHRSGPLDISAARSTENSPLQPEPTSRITPADLGRWRAIFWVLGILLGSILSGNGVPHFTAPSGQTTHRTREPGAG